jgi:hypothetical protein
MSGHSKFHRKLTLESSTVGQHDKRPDRDGVAVTVTVIEPSSTHRALTDGARTTQPSRSVELFSPVPPMRTGTASYLDVLVRRLSRVPGVTETVRIATDPAFMPPGSDLPADLHGIPIEAAEAFDDQIGVGRTRIYFLANNDHHAFAYDALRRQTSRAQGRTICVIHDPSVFMLQRFMTGNGTYRLSEADLMDRCGLQYGRATRALIERHLAGKMPDLIEFVTHAQGLALVQADEIWTHSVFGLAKLVCETALPAHRFPKLRVCAHPEPEPDDDLAPPPSFAPGRPFRIGVFGWVTAPKRVTSVIRGLSLALDRLGAKQTPPIELYIVGRRPADTTYDPAAEARRFNVMDVTRFIDYPDTETFEALQASCHLVFNLRFPSVGETSGTLATVRTGSRVIVSNYQALFESAQNGRAISVLPHVEVWQVAAEICRALEDWQADRPLNTPAARRDLAPIEHLVAREVLLYRAMSLTSAGKTAGKATGHGVTS